MSRKGFIFVVILNSGAKRNVIQNPLHWGWTSSPSPDWGRLGWGVSRKGFFSSLRLEAMRERKRTKPVRWRKTMSFPTARIIQIRHGAPFINCQCVTPASEPESPTSSESFKLIPPFAIRSTMRFRGAARKDKVVIAPHPSPPKVGEGILQIPFPS